MPKVIIVILNWNGLADTLDCLDSVYRLEYPSFEVIVVDNGSSDGSAARIRQSFPQAILIENEQNVGYTGGNNIGIAEAVRRGADYIWLLNNDTEVAADALDCMVRDAAAGSVGMVTPVVYYWEAQETIQYIGVTLDWAPYRINMVMDLDQLAASPFADRLILFGTALMISKELVQRIGYLPEKYFAYQEDFDYSLRALKAGFKTAVSRAARVWHKDSRSTGGQTSPARTYFMTRNLYFLWKDHLRGVRLMTMPGYYLGMMIANARILLDNGNPKSFQACLNGVWDALTDRGGRFEPDFRPPVWFNALFRFFVGWHPYFWSNLFKGNVRGMVRDARLRLSSSFSLPLSP